MEIYPLTLSTELEKINQLGGSYVNGKPLPREVRFRVIQLAQMGVKPCEISRQLRITHGCISKLITKFQETGSIDPGNKNVGRPKVITPDIEIKIDQYRNEQPGIFSWELRERLIKDNVCSQENVPSVSSISRLVKRKILEEAYRTNVKQVALQLDARDEATRSGLECEVISCSKCNRHDTCSTSQCDCTSPSSPSTSPSTSLETPGQRLSFSIEAILNSDIKPSKTKCVSLAATTETSKDPATVIEANYVDCKQYKHQRRHRMVFTSRKANQLEKDLEINPYSGLKRRVKLTTMNTQLLSEMLWCTELTDKGQVLKWTSESEKALSPPPFPECSKHWMYITTMKPISTRGYVKATRINSLCIYPLQGLQEYFSRPGI